MRLYCGTWVKKNNEFELTVEKHSYVVDSFQSSYPPQYEENEKGCGTVEIIGENEGTFKGFKQVKLKEEKKEVKYLEIDHWKKYFMNKY